MEGNKKKDNTKKERGKTSKDLKDSETNTKTTGAKIKERWLLTRKTWRYMSDAGKKLFPDGANPHKKEEVPKFEEQFQMVCDKCEEYILWNPNMRKSHGGEDGNTEDEEGKYFEADYPLQSPTGQTSFDPIKEKLFPSSELGWDLPPEIFNTLLRNYGATTLQRVATKLLEEQLMEEDEFAYDDESGDYMEVDGHTMRSIGTQTDPYLDMCVQTDHDGSAEDDVNVGAETKAETEAAVAYQRALMVQEQQRQNNGLEIQHSQQQLHHQQLQQKHHPHRYMTRQHSEDQTNVFQDFQHRRSSLQDKNKESEYSQTLMAISQSQSYNQCRDEAQLHQEQTDSQVSSSGIPQQGHHSHHHTVVQPQQPISELDQSYQSQRPVLKKFWARRESLTAKAEPQHVPQPEKIGKITDKIQLSIDKEKETSHHRAPPPPPPPPTKQANVEGTIPTSPGISFSTMGQKQDHAKQQEKKKQNVFKLGLKCDVESQQGGGKVAVEKAAMDKFKTVNYDKTLRNIKSKWVPTPEDEEYIRSIERENELERERVKNAKLKEKEKVKLKEREERLKEKEKEIQKEKEKEKKKKKARSIQVGEPLPQFILNSFRINSPVEIIHATKRKLRRFSSKAESISGSECSIPPSGLMSPRFSISIMDDQGSRDLVVSEAEAYKLSQMGIPFIYKRPSTETSSDIGELESGFRETAPPHHFQRSFSAVQASGHISQLLYHLRASRLSNPLWGGSSHLGGRASDRAQRLTHSLLQYLLPAVMQRTRASGGGGHASRLVAKRIWRTRSKSQSRASAGTTSIWTPMGNSTWMSVTGRVLTLESTSLVHLSELERLSLQRISLAKLQAMNLGCQIKVPKETSTSTPNKKRRPYLLKRKALSTGLFDAKKEEHRGTSGGLVFGLSLSKCIENERLRVREAAEREALALAAASTPTGEEGEGSLSRKSSQAGSNASFTSLLEGAKQSTTGSLESLNLERKRPSLSGVDVLSGGSPPSLDLLTVDPVPQVPTLVSNCCRFLEGHGLHTLGIFRVSSSKKRVRQLREEFDSGKEILLTEEHCPHDVATLLKEFFRDLPEPLLTRELYEALLSTQKIRNRRLQLEALQYLIQLLPKANRDTLFSLLNFLTTVADHSSDSECDAGQGNKMDSGNLATLFAPNILHHIKPGSDPLSTSEMAAQAEERIDVINVVRCMIDHNKELFQVSPELLDETYQHLMDSHPEALDILLRRRCCAGLDELDLEVDTNSSVFEGSDASSPLPRSPTDHQEFEKLRSSLAMEESEGFRRDVPTAQEISSERTRRRRRHEEEESRRQYQEKRSSGEGFTEEKGWFRRREKSGSRELERGVDHASERSRWFRRREKTSPKDEKIILRQGSDKNKDKSTTRSDSTRSKDVTSTQELTSEAANDRRNRTLQEQEKLKVPEPSVRRLSSPEIDTFGVITASLKIHVPIQQQSSIAFSKESDSTYVEETNLSEEAKLRLKDGTVSVSSRQRTGSNDSFLGQPITGSMSFQPLCKKDGDKQSYDSVLSSSSIGVYTMSPSERNTPSSDFHCASGTSSPMSAGALSPPLWLSPDSGTPGLSPPSSPPPQRRRSRKVEDSGPKPVPLAHSATHTFGSKPIAPLRVREKSRVQPTPIGRSRTTDSMKLEETLDHKISETRSRIDGSRSRNNTEKETNKKYTRKRYSAERHHTGHLPEITSHTVRASTTESTTQLWKRWEIIASDPTEPETFV